jgi:transcriptional regulator with XRE-family HTH domain
VLEPLSDMTALRRRRLELGLPQWVVARRAGIPVGKLSFAERGVPVLTSRERTAVAAVLGTDEENLFAEEELESA